MPIKDNPTEWFAGTMAVAAVAGLVTGEMVVW